jgi:hypothetical protein
MARENPGTPRRFDDVGLRKFVKERIRLREARAVDGRAATKPFSGATKPP